MARLAKQPKTSAAEWRSLAATTLVDRAKKITASVEDWAAAAFQSRVASGEDPLGDQFTATYSPEERRGIGATLTPPSIVKAIIRWARGEASRLGSPLRVVDPGAGTGRFAIAAASAFPGAHVIAVENDAKMLALLRANLRAAGLTDRIEVIEGDFRSVKLEPINGPTLFLGNPPYVRHHKISADWKRWYVETCARHGIKASQLAGLHLHFFAKVAEVARPGDYGCFITAAEWLDVGYGHALRSLLANGLGGSEIHILEPTAEAFPGTMTTAAITAFRVGQRPPRLRMRSVRNVADLDLLRGGKAVSWERAGKAAKWSLLVYPERRPDAGMVELGEICRVHRGQVTGNNRVWIAGAHARGLPQRFLKPTITRAEELMRAEPILDDDAHLARVIDLPLMLDDLAESERAAVDRFLAWAKATGAADGYIARHRKPWWAVRLAVPAPIVCTYMARRAPAFVRNRSGASLLNIAHGIFPREELSEDALLRLVTLLRTSVRREEGRTYSGGLTKFEPREIERIPVPWYRS